MRRAVDPPLDYLGARLAAARVPANAVTLAGFALGIGCVAAIALGQYAPALLLLALNRLLDGLDGAVARHGRVTDLGGYLDIVCDFLFYAGFAFGFALADPANAVAAAFLLFSFVGTGTSFLAFAILAAKRTAADRLAVNKSFAYLGGLTEGTETILCFVAMLLLPQHFVPIAWVFGALCWVTTASRVVVATRLLSR